MQAGGQTSAPGSPGMALLWGRPPTCLQGCSTASSPGMALLAGRPGACLQGGSTAGCSSAGSGTRARLLLLIKAHVSARGLRTSTRCLPLRAVVVHSRWRRRRLSALAASFADLDACLVSLMEAMLHVSFGITVY